MISLYLRTLFPRTTDFRDELLYYGRNRAEAQRLLAIAEERGLSYSEVLIWHEERDRGDMGRHTGS